MEYKKLSKNQRIYIILGIILLSLLFIFIFSSILMPFVIGFFIAYIFHPIVSYLDKKIPPVVSALIIIALIYFIFWLFILFIIPSLKNLLLFIIDRIVRNQNLLEEYFDSIIILLSKYSTDISKLQGNIGQYFVNIINFTIKTILKIIENGFAVANFFITALFGPLIGFYALKDWDKLMNTFNRVLPIWTAEHIKELFKHIDSSFATYIRRQLLVCMLLSIFYSLCLYFVNIKFCFIIGIVTGLFIFVPYITIASSLFVSILITILQYNTSTSSIVNILIIYISGHILESIILSPYFIGTAVGLHPILILFAVFAGGMLKGLTGIFFAIPIATIIMALFRFEKEYYFKSIIYLGKR